MGSAGCTTFIHQNLNYCLLSRRGIPTVINVVKFQLMSPCKVTHDNMKVN